MTLPVSLLPPIPGASLPPPTPQGLTDDEQRLITGLSSKLTFQSTYVRSHYLYYDGEQRMSNLGVLVPDQLASVRVVVDWPRRVVDPIKQRCRLDGFTLPGGTDVDSELAEHLDANDFGAELPLAFLDAFVAGRGYIVVGSPDVPGDSPIVTVESPLNLAVTWDPRTRRITAAFQSYEVEGLFKATLLIPGQTISMSRDISGQWSLDDRDMHGFPLVPVVRMPNRGRTSDREGRSEITGAVKATTDSACRTLLGMEVAREFYSIPHRYVLGASESDFVGTDGQPKTALQMSMNKFLALERDEQGEVPTVGQFAAFDPSVFTKIVDKHAQLMASYTGYPPAWFGETTSANPASADAIRVSENPINQRADDAHAEFGGPLKQAAQLIWRFAHPGEDLPAEMRQVKPQWMETATPTPAATADAMFKQVQMGAVPPTSDVVLKRLGYDGLERARLEVDRQVDAGASVLAELANSLQAKEARTDLSVAHDINPTAAKAQPGDSTSGPVVGR